MRLFAACLSHETNSFSPLVTGREAFDASLNWRPEDTPLASVQPGMPTAAFWVAQRDAAVHGYDFVPGSCFAANPSGLVTRSAYEGMRDEIVSQVEAAAPLDAIVLNLHGAMMADGYDDCEADLLARIRRVVGPGVVMDDGR